MSSLILYYFPASGPSRAALLAARNLHLDIEVKVINLLEKQQLQPEFISINPQHTIPTLDDAGFILWESKAIMSYLVESKSPDNSLYPSDPKKRALINQRLYFDATVLYPAIRNICRPVLFSGETKITEEKRTALISAFGFLDAFLDGNKWFCGDDLTLADLAILASLASIYHVGADLSKYTKIKTWYEQCRKLPGYEENEAGATVFGSKVKHGLSDKL